MNIAFLGRGCTGLKFLQNLSEIKSLRIKAIFTCTHSSEVGSTESDYKEVADKLGVPYFYEDKINQEKWVEFFKDLNIDLGVTIYWLYIIQSEIIKTAQFGFLNLHGGLLPRYRGNACANWGILSGEKYHGVTVHLMEPGRLDSGPIVLQEKVKIHNDTNVGDLMNATESIGTSLMVKAVNLFVRGEVNIKEQNSKESLYCYPRIPQDGYIDWEANDNDIVRLIRAANRPYPGAYSYFKHYKTGEIKKISIFKVSRAECEHEQFHCVPGHIIKIDNNKARGVCCGNGVILRLDDIEIDGKSIEAEEYFRSVRQRLGILVEDWLYENTYRIQQLEQKIKKSNF